jgi:uncharacterized repeat protein (TIGR03803 family)
MNTFFASAVAIAALGLFAQPSTAATFKVEHNFCAKTNCTDGAAPVAAMTPDGNGNYYGTTVEGGDYDQGTVYLASNKTGHWVFTRIHSFCPNNDCVAGAAPDGGIILDKDGNLYGTATTGGPNNDGVVYEMSHATGKWVYHVLYTFCRNTGCTDAKSPGFQTLTYQGAATGVAYDGTSPLYGATEGGGAQDDGAVFELTKSGTKWTEKVIYSFCTKTNCTDGGHPFGGVVMDGNGNLFGTATLGGVANSSDQCCGVFFGLKHNGAKWSYASLYSFCSRLVGQTCEDGNAPMATPIIDAEGNFYGTTAFGGKFDAGTVYKISPASGGAKATLKVLHNFCSKTDCPDGAVPFATPLLMDSKGTLYGTTFNGGNNNYGTVYSLGGATLDKFTELFAFNNTNGDQPIAGLTMDKTGTLYGTASAGGKNTGGVFFQIDP